VCLDENIITKFLSFLGGLRFGENFEFNFWGELQEKHALQSKI
jgi:hypothetical protein